MRPCILLVPFLVACAAGDFTGDHSDRVLQGPPLVDTSLYVQVEPGQKALFDAALEAAAAWRACGSRQVWVGPDEGVPLRLVPPSDPRLEGHTGASYEHEILIATNEDGSLREDLLFLAMHEIGHSLLGNTGYPGNHFGNGVMSGDFEPPVLTEEDCEVLKRVSE